jgi:predicted  nucleic acid-binding Zn-ribbon protein
MPNKRGSDLDSAYTYIFTQNVHDTYSNPGNIPYKKPQKPQGYRPVVSTEFNKNLTQSKGASGGPSKGEGGGASGGPSNNQTVLTIQHTPAGPSAYQRAKKSAHKYMDRVNNRQARLAKLDNREKNLQTAIATTTDATQLQTLKTQLKTVQAKENKVEKRLGQAQSNLRRIEKNHPGAFASLSAKDRAEIYQTRVNNRQARLAKLDDREKNLQTAIATTTDATQLQTLKTQLKTVQAKENKVEKRLGRAQRNLRRVQGNNPALIPSSTQQSANNRRNTPGKKQMGGAVRGNNQNDSLPTGKVKMAAMNAGGNRNHGNPAGGRRRGR